MAWIYILEANNHHIQSSKTGFFHMLIQWDKVLLAVLCMCVCENVCIRLLSIGHKIYYLAAWGESESEKERSRDPTASTRASSYWAPYSLLPLPLLLLQ